ncbi:cytochrome oxidase Cu insertion factor (SCO1/SenC/PrrC family) [Limimaricola soesokkakensis]|uniref:SCO1/SenC n=1 Tax=Limimaricola soesokkakensis TaxID=1343159 RepID=A0A1X6YZ86_9RHOB|nr:SCO family protein [Limimaricola soesokkakensis]PSK87906.1 cytochrome oxidase Cu insertion factor (SCO1/SenC/PrrC family) [Limimaricola soesokkakensis]SLN35693.1 SCO1/SenC [Limimaricola soesokkakensis]
MIRGFMLRGLAVAAILATAPAAQARWELDYFPNTPLLTQKGEKVRFVDDVLDGRIAVVNFIYLDCPDICGLATARLAKVYEWLGERMGEEIVFVSISLTPERDTPEELAAYAAAFGAGPGWYFLTGDPEEVALLRYKLGERSKQLSDHRSDMLIGNPLTGEWRRSSLMGNLVTATAEILALDPDWVPPQAEVKVIEGETLERFAARNREGEGLFIKGCAACHSIGDGVRVGPDLEGVTLRRDRDWLMRYIMSPDRMLAEGDPIAVTLDAAYPAVRMPAFGLGENDAADLVQYLHSETLRLEGVAEPAAAAHDGHTAHDLDDPSDHQH